MNREIKFRGKITYSSSWVYGNYIHSKRFAGCSNEYRIHDQESGLESDTNPETVGQYTGLKDKNGEEIYEGDILSTKWIVEVYRNYEGTYMIKFHNNPKTNKPLSLKKYILQRRIAGCSPEDCIIIGNIHDNPDLLNSKTS